MIATGSITVGCVAPDSKQGDLYIDSSISALPNLGFALGAGQVFDRSHDRVWSGEFEGTYQFIDDESFADDGNPQAGDWIQMQIGVKALLDSGDPVQRNIRFGVAWFRALGAPNIVQEPGDYLGVYAGIGFETRLSEHWSLGPELSLMISAMEKDGLNVVLVPQLAWHLTWHPQSKLASRSR